MKSQRLKIIGVTLTLFALALLAISLFAREITHQSDLLDEQVTALENDQAQQAQLNQLKKVITRTKEERDQVASYYIESQADSIDFLNYIETLADESFVDLVTKSASEVEKGKDKEKVTSLEVKYLVTSSLPAAERFIKLLENIPFVSEITGVTLTQKEAGEWTADITIEVVILNHENNS